MHQSSLMISVAVGLALSGAVHAAGVETLPVAPAVPLEKPAPAVPAAETPAAVPHADVLESVVRQLSSETGDADEEPAQPAQTAEPAAETPASEEAAPDASGASETSSSSEDAGGKTSEQSASADESAGESASSAEANPRSDAPSEASSDEGKADGPAQSEPALEASAGPVTASGPIALVPPFLDFMPYVTTLKDVEEVFGRNARLYEEGRYGKRHIITGQDFDLGVTSVLVYYTDTGLVSDVFLRIPTDRRKSVLSALRGMTPAMNPDGIWAQEEDGREFWRTKTTELSVGAPRGADFTVEYGATGRQVRETRAWIDADPEKHCPRFAGLLIGRSTLDDLKKRIAGRDCRLIPSGSQEDGSRTYSLTGACFGIPGEYQTLVWTGADDGRITRLFLQSKGDPLGFASVLPALEKRYRPTGREGEFRTADAPARNVWPPVIRFSQKDGSLEFYAGVDGVKKAEAVWDRLLEEKKAREAQARAVDKLFE
ncbi:MAG: hypothetical protein J6K46_07340 [Sutterella sp.]|nr:hypothetical protein [Sutterella sp.]